MKQSTEKLMVKVCLTAFLAFVMVSGCQKKGLRPTFSESDSFDEVLPQKYDLSDIEETGELIAITLSGPETYYQYHGKELGVQYTLAESYANSHGLRLRMELTSDTSEMISLLQNQKVDLIALPLPQTFIKEQGLSSCGYSENDYFWAVRKASPDLASSLTSWFTPKMIAKAKESQKLLLTTPYVRRKVHAYYLNRGKGIISAYDALFVRYSSQIGWDWRLLAAQCYQESAFDPNAVSWAGARGLMQIMPRTAEALGVSTNTLHQPEVSIRASVKYIRQLTEQFQDIPSFSERQKFVLAAYNGGYHHIRDAQRLAEKYHKNSLSWDVVSYYVLHLKDPQYYRDPVVKHGYMIGNETYHYVYKILDRWADYRGIARTPHITDMQQEHKPQQQTKKNRFTKNNSGVKNRDDSLFNISND